MADSLEILDPVYRRTLKAFMASCMQLDAETVGLLFATDGVVEGALSSGALKGRKVVESHFRQVFKKLISKGMVHYGEVTVTGRQVTLEWGVTALGQDGPQVTQAKTILDLDESGLILKARIQWNPRPLMG
jgi:hypothetical protein